MDFKGVLVNLSKLVDSEPIQVNQTIGYVPALDGLRAVAVLLVLLVHAHFQFGSNGMLGVDIFFALSGFLITTLLLEEHGKKKSISLMAFYVRRAFRLFPALYIVLLFVLVYTLLFRTGENKISILYSVLSSALYLNNVSWLWGWGYDGLLLNHTWSLAVEEQFYLVWPWFLLMVLHFKILRVSNVGVVIFILLIFALKITGHSNLGVSLIHEEIFVGCFFAILRWRGKMGFKIPDYISLLFIGVILIVGIFPIKWYQDIYNSGGRSIIALVTSVVIVSVINNPEGLTSRLLSNSLLVSIGKISYALYLWHVPIFRLFNYYPLFSRPVSIILEFVGSFLVATLSWVILEKKSIEYGRKISRWITDNQISLNPRRVSKIDQNI